MGRGSLEDLKRELELLKRELEQGKRELELLKRELEQEELERELLKLRRALMLERMKWAGVRLNSGHHAYPLHLGDGREALVVEVGAMGQRNQAKIREAVEEVIRAAGWEPAPAVLILPVGE